jgi:hypothetical protein
MESEDSLQRPQNPLSGPLPKIDERSPHTHIYFLENHLKIVYSSYPRFTYLLNSFLLYLHGVEMGISFYFDHFTDGRTP